MTNGSAMSLCGIVVLLLCSSCCRLIASRSLGTAVTVIIIADAGDPCVCTVTDTSATLAQVCLALYSAASDSWDVDGVKSLRY